MSFKQHIDEAAKLYADGWSLSQIGKKYHRTRQAVNWNFKRFGIPLRGRGGMNNPDGHTNPTLAGMRANPSRKA